jgi:hypothetical protein
MSKTTLTSQIIVWFKSIKRSKIIDSAAVLIISSVSIFISLNLSAKCPNIFYDEYDIWFGADINRVFSSIANYDSINISRAYLHPIFSLLIFPIVEFLSFFGIRNLNAAYFLISLSGAVVSSLLYITLRFQGIPVKSCLLGSFVFLCSGAYIFWWSVIETFPIGAATISIVFVLLSMRNTTKWIWTVSIALTLSMTITNWIVGILGVAFTFNRIKAIKILSIGFVSVLLLFIVQSFVFSGSKPSGLVTKFVSESRFLVESKNTSDLPHYINIYAFRAVSFFIYPAVVSQTKSNINIKQNTFIQLSVFKYNLVNWLSICCWSVLLFVGLLKILPSWKKKTLTKVLLPFVLFQFLLHLFYGDQPFLYSAHYFAALVIIASHSLHGKYEKVFQLIAIVFCVTALYSNIENFNHAMLLLQK